MKAPMRVKLSQSFETTTTLHPMTQRYILENMNPRKSVFSARYVRMIIYY